MTKRKKSITSLKSKKEIFERLQNKKKGYTPWKMPTKRVVVKKRSDAERIGKAIAHFAGGYEIKKVKSGYSVGSKGYYHYVGS